MAPDGRSEPDSGALPRCPACGDLLGPGTLESRAGVYAICSRCGSARLQATLDPDSYYESYFPAAVREDSPLLARRYHAILRGIEEEAPGRRLLEVGFGNGQLLAVARERGWSVAGTELSRAQVDHGRSRGLDVVRGDLATDRLFPERVFDAVVLIEVLEHLPEPGSMIRAVLEKTAPGGIVYATTPNFSALSRRIIGGAWSVLNREHVSLFTPRGVRIALGTRGFDRVSVRSRNLNPGEILHHAKSLAGARIAAAGDAESRPGGADRASLDPASRGRSAEAVRDRIETSSVLRGAKRWLNVILGALGLGDTMVVRARRAGPPIRIEATSPPSPAPAPERPSEPVD